MFYPNFKFQHPMSILLVGPTNSGKTYFVEQLLSNLDKKMNFKNSNLKCRISWFYGQWQQCYAVMQRKLGKGHQCHRIGCLCFLKWLVAVIDNHTFCHKVACVVWIWQMSDQKHFACTHTCTCRLVCYIHIYKLIH